MKKREYRIKSHGWKWTLFGGLAMGLIIWAVTILQSAL